MKKNWGGQSIVEGVIKTHLYALSDCRNYTSKTLKNSLQKHATRPTGGSLSL